MSFGFRTQGVWVYRSKIRGLGFRRGLWVTDSGQKCYEFRV